MYSLKPSRYHPGVPYLVRGVSWDMIFANTLYLLSKYGRLMYGFI